MNTIPEPAKGFEHFVQEAAGIKPTAKSQEFPQHPDEDLRVHMRIRWHLRDLADIIHRNAEAHGFHEDEGDLYIANQLANLHAEVSELWEAHRAGTMRLPCDKAAEMERLGLPPLTCAEEEYADIVIRVLDQCRQQEIDIANAIAIKHQYNTTRPYKHGKRN